MMSPQRTDPEVTRVISFDTAEQMVAALGAQDEALRIIERSFDDVTLTVRERSVQILGSNPSDVARAADILDEVKAMAQRQTVMSAQTLEQLMSMLGSSGRATSDPTDTAHETAPLRPSEVLTQNILSSRGRTIRPKTLNQKVYVDAIDANTIIFGIGPAGTGKTYLAMAKAVQALQNREVSRIILTRPAVEAGERLGFLPGTLNEKIDPYLRPLYDALHDMMDPDSIPQLMAAGTIEVAPLAYMRGRTLNDAFIILDEAQNTTPEQMKMFLTRLGFGSRIVVTGDVTQVDLPRDTQSGLRQVEDILSGIDDIAFVRLEPIDVVRHRLVSDIVSAYGEHDELTRGRDAARRV